MSTAPRKARIIGLIGSSWTSDSLEARLHRRHISGIVTAPPDAPLFEFLSDILLAMFALALVMTAHILHMVRRSRNRPWWLTENDE